MYTFGHCDPSMSRCVYKLEYCSDSEGPYDSDCEWEEEEKQKYYSLTLTLGGRS